MLREFTYTLYVGRGFISRRLAFHFPPDRGDSRIARPPVNTSSFSTVVVDALGNPKISHKWKLKSL